jgi:hypothetical protein
MRGSLSTTRLTSALTAGACLALSPLAAAAQSAGTVWPDEGPATWAPRPTEPAITANDLRTHVYQLAADSMMGRAAAELGNWKATAYVASVFERLGLQPAGDDGYFQEIAFGPLAFDREAIRLVVDGRALRPGADWAPYAPTQQAGIAGTFEGEGLATVFGGYWNGGATSLSAAAVRGRVAVFDVPDQETARQRDLSLGLQLNGSPIESAGPAAILLVLPGPLNPNALQGSFGLFTEVTGTPVALVSRDVAAAFFERPLGQVDVGATGRPVTGSWDFAYQRPEYPARNVIAVLPGSDPALRGQYVLVGAHNDHEGMLAGPGVDHDSLRAYNRVMRPQGYNDERDYPTMRPTVAQQARIDSLIAYARSIRPPRMDNVMNGADDDASGTAVLLEVAERFATAPAPARSIVFISHTAEESGLYGSRWFVEHPTVPLDSIVAAHNMDMVGKGRVTDVRFGGPAQVQMLGARRLSADFGDVIDSLNAVREETMAIDYSWDRTNALNRFCRSDQLNYFRQEIPVTYFSTGYSVDYHYATDEPQYIDYEKSGRLGRFVHEIMSTVADRPTRLSILPPEERDLSAQCRR